jgi:hypothetical protein
MSRQSLMPPHEFHGLRRILPDLSKPSGVVQINHIHDFDKWKLFELAYEKL